MDCIMPTFVRFIFSSLDLTPSSSLLTSCKSDAMCASDLCLDSVCTRKKNDGEICRGGWDYLCLSDECGYKYAGSSTYVCCAGEAIEHGGNDYCDRLEDGVSCWLDVMCRGGYCGGNEGGLRKGKCVVEGSVAEGGACHNGDDEMCQSNLACALEQADGNYICCSNYGE